MLRITVHNNSQTVTFQLEGRLTGPWLEELDECWQRTLASETQPNVEVDLTGSDLDRPSRQGISGGDAPPGCQLYCLPTVRRSPSWTRLSANRRIGNRH